MTPIIDLHSVTFTYAIGTSPALRDITLTVPAGQICSVVGRAGAGKSTLCALCAGFIPNFYQGQFSGQARIDDQNVVEKSVAELVNHVGLVGSNAFSQISGARFTVYEEIGFGLENIGLPRAEIAERIEWALRAMQLQDLRDRSPYALSGGQQQRLVLASTLAMRPPVLVLDEPSAQLDPPTIAYLADLLRELARQGTTILFAEHRLEWTAGLAQRVLVLDEGQLIDDGPPEQVLTNRALLDRKIGWPRAGLIAARAREHGLWPAERALPVTVEGLVEGLRRPTNDPSTTLREAERPPTTKDGEAQDGQLATDNILQAPRLQSPAPSAPASSLQPPASGRPIIEIDNVRFSYPSGVEALRGVSLRIGPGERIALLGRNGAGKSTLLRHTNGLLLPSSGHVLVAGSDTRKTTVARCARHVGIVFQDIRNQLFARTVRDELRFGPRNLKYPAMEVEALVERAMAALGLTQFADTHPYDLPPALRRLVAVGAVLAMNSDVLVLDEPTAGLDNLSIALLKDLAQDLAAQGKSIVVVSHDLDFCFEALDRVILLQGGQVALDSNWSRLDQPTLAVLEGDVGLPLALQAAWELAAPADSALGQLLASNA
ncbi:MAG TPA: ABC transporter ATP-binding protein [Roseiflexaceae bacterium]|nr:ABC transporter ATP-binding protein [Roseiflexaceae bacterium]